MIQHPIPPGNFIVTHLEEMPHARFGHGVYTFYEYGFDSVMRALNYMDRVQQYNDAKNVRLWGVSYLTDRQNPTLTLMHRTSFGQRTAAQSGQCARTQTVNNGG
jgi:hypothetical protein